MYMFTDLRAFAQKSGSDISEEIALWAKYELLGLCHKILGVLDIPHFAGCLLNPGLGRIPDLNSFLP